MTRRILRRLTGVAAATVVMACEKSPTTPPPTQPAQLHLTALVSASSVTSIVVTVSAADISPSLVFNFPVSNGVAAGTMTVPVGSDRHFRISAFDAGGIETQRADTTITVESGSNPPLAVTLTPLTGSQPIVVTIASLRIAVGPADTTILVGASASFRAQAFDGTGSDITGQVRFAWASSNPSIASVDSQGVVTAHLSGTVSIVAVARGVAGVATLTVVTTERVAVCAAGSPDHLVTFADFPAAIAAVAPGGTIEVCSGTFTAEGVEITKPVTIEAVRGATTPPVIETSTDTVTFFIDSVASGTVAFRGLSFVNTDTGSTVISAIDTYDQVLVEGSTFAIPPIGTGVFGGSSTVAGAKITVTHSAFSGGLRSEEHTSELQSPCNLVCRLLLEKKNKNKNLPDIDKKKKKTET